MATLLFAPSVTLFHASVSIARPLEVGPYRHEETKPVAVVEIEETPRPVWLKNLTIESFGYDAKAFGPGFEFSPAYTASLYNLHGLECPLCVLGPRNRIRFTLPPFGANATWRLHEDRVELYTGFGGIEAWKADGTFEPQGRRLFSNADDDAWLTQVQAGGRIAVDHDRHVWLGATGRYLYNFGPGVRQGTTFSGDATFRLGH